MKVQKTYTKWDKNFVLPLPEPNSVVCCYFRNRGGKFFGELEPYLSVKDDKIISRENYWQAWEENIPNFHMTDVDASSHLMMLEEAQSYEKISKICEKLYSENGVSGGFFKIKE